MSRALQAIGWQWAGEEDPFNLFYINLRTFPSLSIFCTVEKPAETETSNRLANHLVRVPVTRMLLFGAEQQKVAIPGWLHEDQKEGLHQEGHFASIKQLRYPTTKENEAKRRIPCWGGGGRVQDGDPSHSTPTPVATFGLEPANFQEIWQVLTPTGGFW
jgi:hypothetical protein